MNCPNCQTTMKATGPSGWATVAGWNCPSCGHELEIRQDGRGFYLRLESDQFTPPQARKRSTYSRLAPTAGGA